jgi:hypothetical protein
MQASATTVVWRHISWLADGLQRRYSSVIGFAQVEVLASKLQPAIDRPFCPSEQQVAVVLHLRYGTYVNRSHRKLTNTVWS